MLIAPEFRPYIRRAELILSKGQAAVYDGDGSIHVHIDQGFYIKQFAISLRLARINAPEIRGVNALVKKKGIAARDRLYGILSEAPFWIETKEKGKYGRWVAEIFIDDGTNVNDLMVLEGHAVYEDY